MFSLLLQFLSVHTYILKYYIVVEFTRQIVIQYITLYLYIYVIYIYVVSEFVPVRFI